MSTPDTQLDALLARGYQHGFVTDIESDTVPPGLDASTVTFISRKKGEPQFLLDWRLRALERWFTMKEPHWAKLRYTPVDYQGISYYSAPKAKTDGPKSLSEVDPKLLATYEKLGVPLHERARLAGVAVDAVFDSVSVATTFKDRLAKAGVIFCPFSEAVKSHPELVEQYLGTVVPYADNFFAALNSAVFTDGSFVYIPKGVRCPMELSTYFRINAAKTGQFERTLIIADEGSSVSYLEGCTAPMRDENQLHAAVVELVALDDAQIKYSTVQNWYPGDEERRRRHLQLRHQAWRMPRPQLEDLLDAGGDRLGDHLEISELRAARRELGGRVLFGRRDQQLPAGGHRHEDDPPGREHALDDRLQGHLGRSRPEQLSGPGEGDAGARGARNFTQCDSLLIGSNCGAHTVPYIETKNPQAIVEHEASTSRISEEQLFYCLQRGVSQEDAVNMIVSGFCKAVFRELPMEFAVEAQNLLAVSLEGAVG